MLLFVLQGIARGRVLGLGSSQAGIAVWAASSLVVCFAIAVKCGVSAGGGECTGLRLVLVGTALNIIVVLLNQGMPAAYSRGVNRAVEESGGFYVHLNAGTLLPMLGDVVPVSLPTSHFLLSIGDTMLMVGVCLVVVGLMLTGARFEFT
jgi:hypothetical protein